MSRTFISHTEYGHTKAKSLILCTQIQIPIPNKYLGCWYKGLVFCRNNGWIMESMDKGLTVPKWVHWIVRPKIPLMPQNLSAQFVCPSPKVLEFNEKRLHWASVVCAFTYKRNPLDFFDMKDFARRPSYRRRPLYELSTSILDPSVRYYIFLRVLKEIIDRRSKKVGEISQLI